MPGLPETKIPRVPSLIEMQLLRNISIMKFNAERAGLEVVSAIINLYRPVEYLAESEDPIDGIDRLTTVIGRAFALIPIEQRRIVFAGYTRADGYVEGFGYAPKAEIETFCLTVEPTILECQEAQLPRK